MANVYTAADFPTEDIVFGKHKPSSTGGVNIEIKFGENGDNETLMQTPKLRIPFGISTDKNNPFKKTLDFSLQGEDTNPAIKAFRESVMNYEEKIVDYAVANSEKFFKKKLSKEVVMEFFRSAIKTSSNPNYSDTFKCKLVYYKPNPEKGRPDGEYKTSFWSTKADKMKADDCEKGDSVVCLIRPGLFWVANRMFGCTWQAEQVRIHKIKKMNAYSFKDVGEDPADPDAIDDDTDEEEEYEEVEEEEEEEEGEVAHA